MQSSMNLHFTDQFLLWLAQPSDGWYTFGITETDAQLTVQSTMNLYFTDQFLLWLAQPSDGWYTFFLISELCSIIIIIIIIFIEDSSF
jgi:hypothetical protein